MKNRKLYAFLLSTMFACSMVHANVNLEDLANTSIEINDRTYLHYTPLGELPYGNQLCVPFQNRLVFMTTKSDKQYIPSRAMGPNYNYTYDNGKLSITLSQNPDTHIQDSVVVSYDSLKNLLTEDISVQVTTAYFDKMTKSVKTRVNQYTVPALSSIAIPVIDFTVYREATRVATLASEQVYTSKFDITFIDQEEVLKCYKQLTQTIEEVFAPYYPEYTIKSTGEIVKLIKKNGASSVIQHDNGTQSTINIKQLSARRTNRTDTSTVTNEQVIKFITKKGYTSPTDYLVFTDINRQYTHILKKSGTSWTVVKSLLSSTGTNYEQTPTGIFSLTKKVPYFGVEKGYRCKYAVGFIGGTYLFHSTIFDKTGSYLLEGKGVLGNQASQGCIRFDPSEAKWFYETLPLKSTVVIR